jgi:hypothetical protein
MKKDFNSDTTTEQMSGHQPTREESAVLNHVGPHSAGVRQWGPADSAEVAKLVDQLTGGSETNPARP